MRQRIRHRVDAGTPIHAPEPTSVRSGRRWHELSKAYRMQNPLCERCGALAAAVHHRQRVTDDPSLVFAWDNLEALCKRCHKAADAEAARAAKADRPGGGVSRTQDEGRTSPRSCAKIHTAPIDNDAPHSVMDNASDYETGEGEL